MIDVEKLVDAAVDLKVATEQAEEQSIIFYSSSADRFLIYSETVFKELINGRSYEVAKYNGKLDYIYTVIVDELKFIHITDKLLFDGDLEKIREEI